MRLIFALSCIMTLVPGQGFGPQQSLQLGGPHFAVTDLDGDAYPDVVSAPSGVGSSVAWSKNLGGGSFGPQQGIGTGSLINDVSTSDLDGDGASDILTASGAFLFVGGAINWFRNLGGGSFAPQPAIAAAIPGVGYADVVASDLDGDGDPDVLFAAYNNNTGGPWWIAWRQNLGGGSFGPEQVISTGVGGLVHATDLDGDGDLDILSVALSTVVWFENLGGGMFGSQRVLGSVSTVGSVCGTDLDGDGDMDVLVADAGNGFGPNGGLEWIENLGGGTFGSAQPVTAAGLIAYRAIANDLDGDRYPDVVSAESNGVRWYANQGNGSFGPPQVIVTGSFTSNPQLRVGAIDLDGDGDSEVLFAGPGSSGSVAWFENLSQVPAAPTITALQGGGIGSPVFIQNGNLVAGEEYYNVFSADLCPGGPGTGPNFGLCIFTAFNAQLMVQQLLLPVGAEPFHFAASGGFPSFGPIPVAPITVDAICFRVVGNAIGEVSRIARITVQ